MSEVEKVRTVVTPEEAEELFRLAWPAESLGPLRPDVLRLLLAQWDLETAGGKAMFNNNFGNIVAVSDEQTFFRSLDSGNPRRFRSYESPGQGALAYIRQLTRDSRAHWRNGLLSGDPVVFAKELRRPPAYYEAPLDRYTKGLVERHKKYAHVHAEAPPDSNTETVSKGLTFSGFIGFTAAGVGLAKLMDDLRRR